MTEPVATVHAAAEAPSELPPPPPQKTRAGTGVTIVRNSLWLTLDNIIGFASAFFCSVLVARGLGPDRTGEYNYLLWFASLLRMFTEVAIPQTLRKFASEFIGREDYVSLKTLVKSAFRLQSKLAAAGVAVGLILVPFLFTAENRLLAALAVLSVIPALFLSISTGAIWATENIRPNVLSSLCATTLNMAGVTITVILHGPLMWLVVSLLGSRVLDCIIRYILFRRIYATFPGEVRKEGVDPALRARMVKFAAQQLVAITLWVMLFDRMEILFLKALAPTREIAFFSISFNLVQYLLMFPQILAGSASASMMVIHGRAPSETARMAMTTTWFTFFLAAPVLFGIASVSDPLLRLLYGARYLSAIPVLTALALFGISLALSQPAQYLLVTTERQLAYLVCLGSAGVVDIVGNLLLIPHFGALGAACAKGISQIVVAVGCLGYVAVHFRVHLPVVRIVKLLIAAGSMFALVQGLQRVLPPLRVLILGIPAGAVVFFIAVRLLRCLDEADRGRLQQLERLIPARGRRTYLRLINFVVPAIRAPAV